MALGTLFTAPCLSFLRCTTGITTVPTIAHSTEVRIQRVNVQQGLGNWLAHRQTSRSFVTGYVGSTQAGGTGRVVKGAELVSYEKKCEDLVLFLLVGRGSVEM